MDVTMTHSMEAGPELDALIAEKVMGWSPLLAKAGKRQTSKLLDVYGNEIPLDELKYSTDISAAWEVAEKFPIVIDNLTRNNYQVTIGWKGENYVAESESPAHAICLAALKAVGHDE